MIGIAPNLAYQPRPDAWSPDPLLITGAIEGEPETEEAVDLLSATINTSLPSANYW